MLQNSLLFLRILKVEIVLGSVFFCLLCWLCFLNGIVFLNRNVFFAQIGTSSDKHNGKTEPKIFLNYA